MDLVRDILAMIGGVGVVIVGIWKLLGGVVQDRLKEFFRRETELELESVRHTNRTQESITGKLAQSQFQVYVQMWESLQGLKLAVDATWEVATKENIALLAEQLRTTRSQINNWSLLINDGDLRELNKLFQTLECFRAGKITLLEIRSRADLRRVYPKALTSEIQVERNRGFKREFEVMLDKLKHAFRARLSEPGFDDVA